jgi:riboflavin transporter FmnP
MRTITRYALALPLSLAFGSALAFAGMFGVFMLVAFSGLESVWPRLGSDKAPAVLGLLIGGPIGCMIGVAVVSRLLLPLRRMWLGILVGFVLYDLAVMVLLAVAEKGSSIPQYVVMLFPAALAMAGFYGGCKRKTATA